MPNPSISFKWSGQALKDIERNTLLGIFDLAQDIRTQARLNAPYLTGALSNSIRVEEDGFVVYIKAGGTVAQSTRGPKRIDYAQKLMLEHPEMKTSTVGEASGFANETSFFRTFKSVAGMTPREWMQSQTES